jgi:hypothetical protein
MRLRAEKIQQLAELVYGTLSANPDLQLSGRKEDVVHAIQAVITEDLAEEIAIEDEAKKILEKHANEIRRTGASYDQMFRKTKEKIARDRGMVL